MPLTPHPQADASGRILYSFNTWVTKESSHEMPRGDPRLNAIGGVSLRGDTGTGTGLGCTSATPALSSEFEIVACVRRTSSDATMRRLACIQTSGGHINVCFGAATSGGTPMLGWGGNYEVTVPNPTDWHWVSFGHDALGWFFTLDGVLTRSASLTGQTPVAINRVFAGDSGVGQFGGDVSRIALFNFALSESQRAKLILNEPGADVVGRGAECGAPYNGTPTWGELDSFSVIGRTIVASSTGGYKGFSVATPFSLKKGDKVRVRGTVMENSLNTGALVYFMVSSVWDGSDSTDIISAEFIGDFEFTHTASADGARPWFAFFNTVIGGLTIENFVCEILGAVGRWEPLNVTLLPRWLDSSGNGNDLIPATTNSGLTPLNPQPKQPRRARTLYDMRTSTAIILTKGWTVSHVYAGGIQFQPPSFVPLASLSAVASNAAYTQRLSTSVWQESIYLAVELNDASGTTVDGVVSVFAEWEE